MFRRRAAPDNVTELYPDRARRRRLRRLLGPLAALLVAALLGVSLYLLRGELDLDRLRRYIRYLGVRGSETYGVYSFDAHSSNAYAALGDALAVGSVTGLNIYGPSGEELAAAPAAVGSPAVEAEGNLAVLWDVGGTALTAASAESGQVLDLQLEKPVLDADLSRAGELCYASAADGYRTILTVLDAQMKERYRWLSSSQYLTLCAISDGGGLLAAVAVGQSGGAFESSLQIFHTDQEAPGQSVPLGGQMILDLDFLQDGTICAVGESSVQFFDGEGGKRGEFSYGGRYLRDFCLMDGGAAVCLSQFQSGSQCELAAVGPDGQEMGRTVLNEELLSLSAAGGYLAALTPGCLRVYAAGLKPYYETDETAGASCAAVRGDGTALLIGGGGAWLYLP